MSKIEWTEQTWNPIIGCSHISAGCDNCYAEKMAGRLSNIESTSYYKEVTRNIFNKPSNTWNGRTFFVKSALQKPMKRHQPAMYFVCSMGDLFHESVPFEWIDKVMAVIAQSPHHTFQILTKRPDRMKEYMLSLWQVRIFDHVIREDGKGFLLQITNSALPNLWLGVTAENQEQANKRIPILLDIPAEVRFVSCEPLLGPIDFYDIIRGCELYNTLKGFGDISGGSMGIFGGPKLDWVICGGETGSNARPMHPDWVKSLRDQCKDANVPFFFKSWGEWIDIDNGYDVVNNSKKPLKTKTFGSMYTSHNVYRIGKKKAGHLISGVEHHESPKGGKAW